jgi:hypothetical protein
MCFGEPEGMQVLFSESQQLLVGVSLSIFEASEEFMPFMPIMI